LADGVRMKNADLSGFEVEYTGKQQSVPDFKIEVPISRLKLKADIDYDISEMTPEQLEVFEALNYEGDEADYEELEDDFVLMANEGVVPLQSKEQKTEMADDLAEAIKKDNIKNKKFKGDLINSENTKKDDNKEKKLLDNLEVWNEDEMDRCGYFIEAKGLHAGLKINDKDEFPDLCINADLPDIDSPSYKNNNLNEQIPVVDNAVID
jgi:hypothetical protein